ncbi:hypothetical protein C8T65DRAFT_587227 [Cerioporus squamosus]|nr:hypothetical protein C8T65DRAFT_587227 [Cerioporus squamosus]
MRVPGETEVTFFESFCLGNNLKALMVSRELPIVLHDFIDLIDCSFSGDVPESDTTRPSVYAAGSEPMLTVHEKKASPLPFETYQALLGCIQGDPALRGTGLYRSVFEDQDGAIVLNPQAELLQHVEHRGLRYCTYSHYPGDSHVLFRASTAATARTRETEHPALSLGQIQAIFIHKRLQADGKYLHQTFAALRTFGALSEADQCHDPYRRYNSLRATLIYSSPARNIRVVPMRDITAQFVACPYRHPQSALSRPCMVAIPLDEVSVSKTTATQACANNRHAEQM